MDDSRAESELKGKLERSLEFAKKMKASGLSVEQINQWTGLSNKEIEQIK